MNEEGKKRTLNQIAEQAVPDNLDLWMAIRSRIESAAGARPNRTSGAAIGKSGSRRLLVALAASVLLALAIGATFPLWSHPEEVSAESVLARAQSTVDGAVGVKTYHLKMTRQVPGKGSQTVNTEVWFGGSDRQRTDTQVKDPNGAVISTSEVVFDGAQTWIATPENGQTRVIHTVGTTWNKPADIPNQENSLSDVLASYSNDKTCMNAQLQGEATVAGRAAYQILVTPKPDGCAPNPGPTPGTKTPKSSDGGQIAQGKQFGQMLVWVDKESYLPLKTEVRDQSGGVIDRSEATSVEYNVTIPDSIFSYTPPAGAIVSNFTGGTGADVKRSLYGDPPSKSKSAKKP